MSETDIERLYESIDRLNDKVSDIAESMNQFIGRFDAISERGVDVAQGLRSDVDRSASSLEKLNTQFIRLQTQFDTMKWAGGVLTAIVIIVAGKLVYDVVTKI